MVAASETVGSMRWPMSLPTGSCEKIDTPRSPLKHRGDPTHELHSQRIVEAEFFADGVDLHLGCVVTDDDGGRIAGRQVQQQENEHRDNRHDQHGRERVGGL